MHFSAQVVFNCHFFKTFNCLPQIIYMIRHTHLIIKYYLKKFVVVYLIWIDDSDCIFNMPFTRGIV